MKKILFFALIILYNVSHSQTVDLKWSKPSLDKKKQVGYSDVVEGEGKYLYTTTISGEIGFTWRGRETESAYVSKSDNSIIAYDRVTLDEVAKVTIVGKNSLLSEMSEFKDYLMARVFSTDEKIVVFLSESTFNDKEKVAVLELTPDLKPIGGPKVIHEVKSKKKYSLSSTLVQRNARTGKYLLMNEEEGEQGNIKMMYVVYNLDYSKADLGEVNLPFVWDGNASANFRDYQWLGENFVILNSDVKEHFPDAPRKKQWVYYSVFTAVNLSQGKASTYTLKNDELKYSGINLEINDDRASLLGFYSNTNEEGENPVLNGFFSCSLNLNTGEFSDIATTEFDYDFYTNFKNHYPDKVKGNKTEIPYHYVNGMRIEKRLSLGNKTILICSIQNNEKIKYSNGNELKHCVNRGVISFVLNSEMKIEKYNIIPRVARYDFLHNVDDMTVAQLSSDSYIIVYSSNADLKEVNKEGKPEFLDSKVNDRILYYAVMNRSGEMKEGKFICDSNLLKTEKEFAFLPYQMKESGGKLYIFGLYGSGNKEKEIAIGTFEIK
ncbi:MAG: hypothetical protein ACK4WD_10165 [Flavobacteriales bacterium]|jgi:hypothetical protein